MSQFVRIPTILNKQPRRQPLQSSQWTAKVLVFSGDCIESYWNLLQSSKRKCLLLNSTFPSPKARKCSLQIIDNSNSPFSHAWPAPALARTNGSSSPDDTHRYFLEFPEALHKPSLTQCIKFNKHLMRKLVAEKRRKNMKFQESKMMCDTFKYYTNGSQSMTANLSNTNNYTSRTNYNTNLGFLQEP